MVLRKPSSNGIYLVSGKLTKEHRTGFVHKSELGVYQVRDSGAEANISHHGHRIACTAPWPWHLGGFAWSWEPCLGSSFGFHQYETGFHNCAPFLRKTDYGLIQLCNMYWLPEYFLSFYTREVHESERNIPVDFGYMMFCDKHRVLPAKSQRKKILGFHKMKLLAFG